MNDESNHDRVRGEILYPSLLLALTALFIALALAEALKRYDNYAPLPDLEVFAESLNSTIARAGSVYDHLRGGGPIDAGRLMDNPAELNHFAVHFSPLLLPLAGAWALYKKIAVLLFVHVMALAAAAICLFAWARKAMEDGLAALLVAAAFLCCPLTHGLAVCGFQPLALAVPLLVGLFWMWTDEKWGRAWVLLALLLSVRQDAALAAAMGGAWLALARRQWKQGLAVVLVSMAYFIVATQIVMPWFGADLNHSHWPRYVNLGQTPAEALHNFFHRPAVFWQAGVRAEKYLLTFLATTGGVPLLGWPALVVALPSLAFNCLTFYDGMRHFSFHYHAIPLAVCFAAAVIGLTRLRGRPRAARALAAVMLLGASIGIAFHPEVYDPYHPSRPALYAWPRYTGAEIAAIDEARRQIPWDATVATTNSITPHFWNQKSGVLTKFEFLSRGPHPDFLLLDMQALHLREVEDFNDLVALIVNEYQLIRGGNGDRILLYRRK